TDPNTRRGEDRVRDRWNRWRQGRLAKTGRREVGLKELDFDRRGRVSHTRRLVLVEITLHDAALVDCNFPRHHVTHGLDKSSLDEVGGVKRVHGLTANVYRGPYFVDFRFLLGSDCDFHDISDVAGMRKLECDPEPRTFR